MNRLLSLLLAFILVVAPAKMWASDVLPMQSLLHSIAGAATHNQEAGEAADQHHGHERVDGCSDMPGHCMAEVIVPGASHFDTVRTVLIRFPIHVHESRIGMPVSADPPPPRA